jgi:hypothetical protein
MRLSQPPDAERARRYYRASSVETSGFGLSSVVCFATMDDPLIRGTGRVSNRGSAEQELKHWE